MMIDDYWALFFRIVERNDEARVEGRGLHYMGARTLAELPTHISRR